MKNLNKENFWNDMQDVYPKTMKKFCDWIDQYKIEINWSGLFNGDIAGNRHVPKFHDIPLEMQYGIVIQFCLGNLIKEKKQGIDIFRLNDMLTQSYFASMINELFYYMEYNILLNKDKMLVEYENFKKHFGEA